MSTMNTQRSMYGYINILLIPLILVTLLLFGAAGFGYWAFSGRQDYKNNVDQKIAAAVEQNTQQVSAQKEKDFAEREKSPLKTYVGPSEFASLHIQYPKSWSGYVSTVSGSSSPVDGYFYPNVVPTTDGNNTVSFALRVQVQAQSYDNILQNYQAQLQDKTITVKPYRMPKVSSVVGVKITGQIFPQKKGTLIVLPIRDKSLMLWTEGSSFQKDFDNIIVPNFTFSP